MNPQARPYYGANPAPGIYAISATNLQGVHFADHDQFAWFREREPIDKLGYSIFLYEVPPTGEQVDLVLANAQVDQLPPALYDRLGTNDVRLHWVDPRQSLIVPAGEQAWLARPDGQDFHPALTLTGDDFLADGFRDDAFELASYNARHYPDRELARFSTNAGQVILEQAQILGDDGSKVDLLTTWRQDGPPQPLKIFVHALDQEGRILAQWDGVGAAWQGWLAGDRLYQIHELPLPEDAPGRVVKLVTGLYDPQTGARWQTETGADFFEIQE
jgi:hypothetical protein